MHEQEDDPLGPGREVRRPRGQGVRGIERHLFRPRGVAAAQPGQSQHAEAAGRVPQQAAPGGGPNRVHVFDRLPKVHRSFPLPPTQSTYMKSFEASRTRQ